MWIPTADLQGHLGRLTYKPGWELQVRDGRWEGQHFTVRATVPNSYRPDELTELDVHSKLPPMRTLAQFEEWIAWRLIRLENHEAREWFKRDGRPIYDPHRSDRDL